MNITFFFPLFIFFCGCKLPCLHLQPRPPILLLRPGPHVPALAPSFNLGLFQVFSQHNDDDLFHYHLYYATCVSNCLRTCARSTQCDAGNGETGPCFTSNPPLKSPDRCHSATGKIVRRASAAWNGTRSGLCTPGKRLSTKAYDGDLTFPNWVDPITSKVHRQCSHHLPPVPR